MTITRPNQVWCTNITHKPSAHGFVHLTAVIGWFSCRILSWRVRIGLEAIFCVEALEKAVARHGTPNMFGANQGSLFTGRNLAGLLLPAGIAIGMDDTGSWRDNVLVERLWRSVGHEEVDLRACTRVGEARASPSGYLAFHNEGLVRTSTAGPSLPSVVAGRGSLNPAALDSSGMMPFR